MKKRILLITFLVIYTTSIAQLFNPQSKEITNELFPEYEALENITPALKKKKGYTNYKEMIAFLTDLVKQHPSKIKLTYIGKSQKGKQIPMVQLTSPNNASKIKVWMQGGLHGDEPASTEGMLYLIHRIVNDSKYSRLLNTVNLTVVPMANIDGYLKQDRMAANGLDLNRDQTKLMAPESIILKKAFTNFNPEVGLDFHEYRPYRKDFTHLSDFGIAGIYDVMFLCSGNLNVPKNLRDLTTSLFVKNASNLLDSEHFSNYNYITSRKVRGELHFNEGSSNARSSATNYALTNTISSIIETRGIGLGKTSFKRRVYTAFLTAISYLETASKNKKLIFNEIAKANKLKDDAFVGMKKKVYKKKIKAIDVNTNKAIDLEITVRDALKATPKITRKRPVAYIIEANQKNLVEKLKILGVKVEELTQNTEIDVQMYRVTEYKRKSIKYEGMNRQIVKTVLIHKKKTFKKGDYKIPMNQRRSNIIIEVLEPEISSGFVGFGVLKTTKDAILPIYRVLN